MEHENTPLDKGPNHLSKPPSSDSMLIWLVVEPTHLKNIRQTGFIFPKVRGENAKNIWVATTSRWFKVLFSSPIWRSLNPFKSSLNHPKKVTLNHQASNLPGWFPPGASLLQNPRLRWRWSGIGTFSCTLRWRPRRHRRVVEQRWQRFGKAALF